jgi:uncharacterized membrane protein
MLLANKKRNFIQIKFLIVGIILYLITNGDSSYISINVLPSNPEINQISIYTIEIDRNINPLTNQFISQPSIIPVNSYI